MRLIDADKLQQFPIRANRCDKEHANKHFINGIESVMEYAELLPTNFLENLEWCTPSYNRIYGKAIENHAKKIRGVPHTEEHKQKISAGLKAYYGERKEGTEC